MNNREPKVSAGNWPTLGFDAAVIVCALVVYFWGQARVFFRMFGDERVHAYIAHRVSEGAALYGTVHSARPPLALWFLAFAQKVGLSDLTACRLLVVFATMGTASIIHVCVRKKRTSIDAFRAATLSTVFFLVASEQIMTASFTTLQFVTLGSMATLALVALDLTIPAGIAAGLALCSGQHAAVVVLGAFVWTATKNWRAAALFAGSAFGVVALVLGVAFSLGGAELFQDLFGIHLYHFVEYESSHVSALTHFMLVGALDHAPIYLLSVIAMGKAALRRSWSDSAWFVTIGLAHLGAVAAMEGGAAQYVQVVLPLFCAAAGPTFVGLLEGKPRRHTAVTLATCAFAAVTLVGWVLSHELSESHDASRYPWVPHARNVRMSELQRLDVLPEIAQYVRAHSAENETVFGQSSLASAVALGSGRRVAADLSDLAAHWFVQGLVSRRDVMKRIEADNVKFFVTPPWFYTRDGGFRTYLEGCYHPPRPFQVSQADRDPSGLPVILLFEHRPGRCQIR